jgi:mRNA-degrading endonuclease RelE of RelBE toxin-antitoxin system
MIVEYTDEFARSIRSVRDAKVQDRIRKMVDRLIADPECGRPLRYGLQGKRSLRLPPFRIIYEIDGERLILHAFENRDTVSR